MYPPFYVEYSKDYLNKEFLEEVLKKAKSEYGNDFKVIVKVTGKIKLSDDVVKELNKSYSDSFKAKVNATECYEVKGTFTYKGSKKEETQSIYSTGYCKIDGTWYLVQI
jgi:hypothetical protein